ncbi:MAG: hypothetical protein MK085_02000 [Phycisphaerales bacterium]|nr:hypothetical protein [Phycisphaerales bacterium]
MRQIHERGGAIEFTVAQPDQEQGNEPSSHASGSDLVWRVKILQVSDEEIVVESPMALGRDIRIEQGMHLVGAIAIGQNRWTFRTINLGPFTEGHHREHPGLRLKMPESVDRSQRRRIRVDTQAINLPKVEIWPLLDPKTVIPAERANELAFAELQSDGGTKSEGDNESQMPTVGPKFTASLANLGGGGVGLVVESEDAGPLGRHRVFWLRLNLAPELPIPAVVSGKVVHTHIDSAQRTYAGVAFDFSFNPGHQQVLAAQIAHYITQRQELQRQANEQREMGRID